MIGRYSLIVSRGLHITNPPGIEPSPSGQRMGLGCEER